MIRLRHDWLIVLELLASQGGACSLGVAGGACAGTPLVGQHTEGLRQQVFLAYFFCFVF